jgi:hypothetical protein
VHWDSLFGLPPSLPLEFDRRRSHNIRSLKSDQGLKFPFMATIGIDSEHIKVTVSQIRKCMEVRLSSGNLRSPLYLVEIVGGRS